MSEPCANTLRALVYGYSISVEFSLRSPRSLRFNYTLEIEDLRHRSKKLLQSAGFLLTRLASPAERALPARPPIPQA